MTSPQPTLEGKRKAVPETPHECSAGDEISRENSNPQAHGRWRLIGDVLVLQVKLVLDGLMDFLLGPLSLVAAAIGLVGGSTKSERLFYDLLRKGRRFDRWINLFGAADEIPDESSVSSKRIDDVMQRVEEVLREEQERGGITASAKAAIDRSLDKLQGR